MANSRARVLVSGIVQGVGFRAWAQRQAQRLEVSGWVRNRDDGNVELLLEGGEEAVSEMITLLHEGPRAAMVDRVDAGYEDFVGEFQSFALEP